MFIIKICLNFFSIFYAHNDYTVKWLLLHEQFSKVFIRHLSLGFSTTPLLLPSHDPREQGDVRLTLAGTTGRREECFNKKKTDID